MILTTLAAVLIGGWAVFGSFAATPDAAQVSIDPSKAGYTLPAAFWGLVEGRGDTGADRAPDYVRYATELHPEVVRYTASCDPGTPTAPTSCMPTLKRFADFLTPNGTKIYLQMQTEPRDGSSPADPANVKTYGSPDAQQAWLKDWAARYGIGNIVAAEWTNEPQGKGGQQRWFGGDKAKINQWLGVMQTAYDIKLHQVAPAVDVLGMAWAGGGALGSNWRAVLPPFLAATDPSHLQVLSLHGYGQQAWKNPIPLYSNFRNPLDPVLRKQIDQDKMNHYFYLPFDPGKSGYQASFGKWRQLLDERGERNTKLAMTEYGYFDPGPPGALADVAMAIVSANNQKNWNLRYFVSHSMALDVKDLDAGSAKEHGPSILLAKPKCDLSSGTCVVRSSRYFAFQQLIGPFLHNYKRQIGANGISVSGADPTPSSSRGNSITKLQAAAGLNADSSELGVLIGNFDLYNSQAATIDFGRSVVGPIRATRLPDDHSFSGNRPFPVTALTASGSTVAVNLGPGEAYLLEIPLSGPRITGFRPASGVPRAPVTISGSGLSGASSVRFNGVSTPVISNTATAIKVLVPRRATSGRISVTTPVGTATSAKAFVVKRSPVPKIANFSPRGGVPGTSVRIVGSGLLGATAVRFHGVKATITLDTASAIKVLVPAGARSGKLSVRTPGGTAFSKGRFTVG